MAKTFVLKKKAPVAPARVRSAVTGLLPPQHWSAPPLIQVESRIGGRSWWSDLDDHVAVATVAEATDLMHKLMGANSRLTYRVVVVVAS